MTVRLLCATPAGDGAVPCDAEGRYFVWGLGGFRLSNAEAQTWAITRGDQVAVGLDFPTTDDAADYLESMAREWLSKLPPLD
jgi:hypothetical protein